MNTKSSTTKELTQIKKEFLNMRKLTQDQSDFLFLILAIIYMIAVIYLNK